MLKWYVDVDDDSLRAFDLCVVTHGIFYLSKPSSFIRHTNCGVKFAVPEILGLEKSQLLETLQPQILLL